MANAFETLGLEARFEVEPSRVERAYLRLVAGLHPDAEGGGDEDEAKVAALNRARAVLLNPEKRAHEVLGVIGGTPGVEEKALPPGFLMEMMETREEVEAALASGDEGARARWREWARAQRREYVAKVGALFEAARARPDEPRRELREVLNAWRYIERLAEQLEPGYDPGEADFA
ncbi:MAG: DnaJ domain-containing protein [Tepidisphaera sp.]|nr:DnaJ domain-containing protein [Tepidisphaera sp.]